MDTTELAKSDGVSDYSYEWWQAAQPGGTAAPYAAINETLAEMARIKHETGKLPEHMGERIISYRGEDKPAPTKKQIAAGRHALAQAFPLDGEALEEPVGGRPRDGAY